MRGGLIKVVTSEHDLGASSTGYCNNKPETRKNLILSALKERNHFSFHYVSKPQESMRLAQHVHHPALLEFFNSAWDKWETLYEKIKGLPDFDFCLFDTTNQESKEVPAFIPSFSASRDNIQRPGNSIFSQICYFAQDRQTPIRSNTASTLKWDLSVLEDATDMLKKENGVVYALVTFPGHHSGYESFGGFCFINVAAVSTSLLREKFNKIAIVDVDYHAGNGTTQIFWDDPNVLMISLHADPDNDYPYNSGYSDQIGGPNALNLTLNIPLPPKTEWGDYKIVFQKALDRVREFGAEAVVVSLGLDTLRDDPVQCPFAGISLDAPNFIEMGKLFTSLELPMLFIQEGGYELSKVPTAVDSLFLGVVSNDE